MSNKLPRYEYRERCLREKGEQCIVCDSDENIVVHHVDGSRNNNELENLIPVCERCHADIHAKRERVAEWVRKLGYQPKSDDRTAVEVKHETWEHLNAEKRSPGDSFDDVIQRLLDEDE